jgi:hypothetical protein
MDIITQFFSHLITTIAFVAPGMHRHNGVEGCIVHKKSTPQHPLYCAKSACAFHYKFIAAHFCRCLLKNAKSLMVGI